ncbi:MAG: type III-A CRISPR-associated protein Cas10/Csm1, partial [Acetobacteraceae bacterium]|nr:type III-A CRISPR-associated protein Cas10/Csm1 [Acetobacteraceae bacterium]
MTEAAATNALTPIEAAFAGLLHDIGKLAQRAHPNEDALARLYAEVGRDLAGTEAAILPLREFGRYSHRHALWSDFFFVWTEQQRLRWPGAIDGNRVKAVAVRHHSPRHDDPGDWILAEADRLASGLERKPKDEKEEADSQARPKGFRETELRALVPPLDIAVGPVPRTPLSHPADILSADAIIPRPPAPADQPRRMGAVWDAWCKAWQAIAQHALSPARFEHALLSLSERLLWAVPSSTVDQPDISLHDHARAVAGIAAALAAWHRAGAAWDVPAVKDRAVPKFRLVVLDLSGIQHALFRLADQGGAARILRARSFLMAETVSAGLLTLLGKLELPASSVLLNAGGKAELLVPALPDLDARLEAFRTELDEWMVRSWQGDLALIVAAGAPFAAKMFANRGEGLPGVRAELAARLEDAKHRPLSGWGGGNGLFGTGKINAPFGADGACVSCGVRPAVVTTAADATRRCLACDAATRLGQKLPKTDGFALAATETDDEAIDALPPPWHLLTWPEPGRQAELSVQFEDADDDPGSRVPRPRAHVPRLTEADLADPRYAGIGGEHDAGGLKSFAHIAADALEPRPKGDGFQGRQILAVLKADVDRLGLVFTAGLGNDHSPARVAALSRMMDAYFSRRLPWLLRGAPEFASTYTVYAGGDDLLLVLPWRFGLPLALALREDFGRFAGGNPNLSLSAGLAFVHAHHPIARAVEQAEEALGAAKDAGRDRVGIFARAFAWDQAGRV